ncbi:MULTISPECIES: hypothetical protein [Yersinia]|uniref:hypothetical protein n=1 Tax=Yersinia TaxID=629 RepID=UPI0009B6FCA3|nr:MULTISPECIES: hypothetical protein [Yersinia]
MAKIKVHAANFPYEEMSITSGSLFIKTKWYQVSGDIVLPTDVITVEVASEDSVKKVGGAMGWGVIGGVLMGPVGLIAGVLLGGNKKDVTFIAELSGERKFMATTDSKTFISFQSRSLKL